MREAIQACQDLSAGAGCQLRAPEGEIAGECATVTTPRGERLVCRPADERPGAAFPIVDTGQSACFSDVGDRIDCPPAGDPLFGQDAQHPGLVASYQVNPDPVNEEATVTDLVTGLIWQRSPDTNRDGVIDQSDELTYDQALAYCDHLEFAGASDWRLPDIKTLYSLIDFNGIDPHAEWVDSTGLTPFIDNETFHFAYGDVHAGERIIDAQFASSTRYVSELANHGGTLFGVNFADGRIKGYGLSVGGGKKASRFCVCVVIRITDATILSIRAMAPLLIVPPVCNGVRRILAWMRQPV
jgi:hypothetical protein